MVQLSEMDKLLSKNSVEFIVLGAERCPLTMKVILKIIG
jgi:hypothetical protein